MHIPSWSTIAVIGGCLVVSVLIIRLVLAIIRAILVRTASSLVLRIVLPVLVAGAGGAGLVTSAWAIPRAWLTHHHLLP